MKKTEFSLDGQLVNVFFDLFVVGVHSRDSRDLGQLDLFRARIEHMFQEADRKGVELGYARDVLIEARYAVVAFLDEMILQSGWSQKSEWASNSLQYQYFETQVAGEEFFKRLETHRRVMPGNPDLLEVFHVCLSLGFEGTFKLHGREKLKDLTHDLVREIHKMRGEPAPFSPQTERREEVLDLVRRDVPVWVVAACSAAIVFFTYVGLSVLIDHETADAVEHFLQIKNLAKV